MMLNTVLREGGDGGGRERERQRQRERHTDRETESEREKERERELNWHPFSILNTSSPRMCPLVYGTYKPDSCPAIVNGGL